MSSSRFDDTIFEQFDAKTDLIFETLQEAFFDSVAEYQNGVRTNSFDNAQFKGSLLVISIVTNLSFGWLETQELNKPKYNRINLQENSYPYRILEGYALYIVDELLNDNQTYLKDASGSNQTLRQRMKLSEDSKFSQIYRNLTKLVTDPNIFNDITKNDRELFNRGVISTDNQKRFLEKAKLHARKASQYSSGIETGYLFAKSNLGDIPFRLVADHNKPCISQKLIEGMQDMRFIFMSSLMDPFLANNLSNFVRENQKTIEDTISLVQLSIQEFYKDLNKPINTDMDSYLASLGIADEKNS